MRIRSLVGVAVALGVAVLPATAQSIFAPEESEEAGLLISLEVYAATIGNGPYEYAAEGVPAPPDPGPPPVGGGGGGGTIRSIDFSSEASPDLTLGWSFGGEYGVAAVRWWSLDAEETAEIDGGFNSLGVGEILVPPTFFDNRADAALALADIELTTIDLLYGQEIGSSSGRVAGYWRAGIRSFEFEQIFNVDYILFGSELDLVRVSTKVDGIGPLIGLGGRVEIGSRVRLAGDIGMAYTFGDADYLGEWTVNDPSLTTPVEFRLEETGEDASVLQLEGNLGVGVHVWRNLEVEVGYRFQNFQELVRRAGFVDDIGINTATLSDSDLSTDGPYLAVRWKGPFGR